MIKKIQSLFLSFVLILTSFIGLGQIATVAVADDFPAKPIEVVTPVSYTHLTLPTIITV